MPSLTLQVLDREDDSSETSTFSQSKWATDIPESMSLLTQYAAHVPEERKDPTTKIFDDDGWIRRKSPQTSQNSASRTTNVKLTQNKVRPIQMGEFLRKYVSWRLQTLRGREIAAVAAAMRQLGVGPQGGPEVHAVVHQLIFDEWASGTLDDPLAGMKVYEQIVLEWLSGVLCETRRQWRGGNTEPCLVGKKRESNRCPNIVAQSKETLMALQSAVWLLEWQRLKRDCALLLDRDTRLHKKNGSLADQWYLDDGDILCQPICLCCHRSPRKYHTRSCSGTASLHRGPALGKSRHPGHA